MKKRHTLKNVLLVDSFGSIHFLSDTYEGRVHDKCIADEARYTLPTGSIQDLFLNLHNFGLHCVSRDVADAKMVNVSEKCCKFSISISPTARSKYRFAFLNLFTRMPSSRRACAAGMRVAGWRHRRRRDAAGFRRAVHGRRMRADGSVRSERVRVDQG